ncbi:hypothetical protein [Nostoc sp.]|uniref:hypothetical protein n=1 Tax=Nostoc sp. TaxID=1180 RepID=UPI002FFCBA4E
MDSELLSASRFANPFGFYLGSDVYDGLRLRIPRRLKLLIQLCVWDAIAYANTTRLSILNSEFRLGKRLKGKG